MSKTIAFFGASAGCGLAALRLAVDAGHTCIALCRTPSKLEAEFPKNPANLIIKQGNAHSVADVSACLVKPTNPSELVDIVHFSIGGVLDLKTMTIPDPDVCKNGIKVLLDALKELRASGSAAGRPAVFIISTTGISKFGRDVPIAFLPMYHYMLKMPHADKKVMEELVAASGERFTLVRPSFLTDGEQTKNKIRVGIEDVTKGWEKKAIGYTISRGDVGKWMYEQLYLKADKNVYEGKAVTISY